MRYNRFYKENNFLTPTTYTQQLSEYAEKLKFEDIPPQVIERAKMILLQTVGVALSAKGKRGGKYIAFEHILPGGSPPRGEENPRGKKIRETIVSKIRGEN